MNDRMPPGRRTAHATSQASWMPISRASAQVWGLEQLTHSFHESGPRRRPLRMVVRWIATTFGRIFT